MIRLKLRSALLLFTLISTQVSAQAPFYANDSVHEVRFYFTQSNWDHLLDSFYVDGKEERLLAAITIDGTRYDSVGIRYKGFSSVSVSRQKNPFNVKLDYIKNQEHQGIDKLKLSNVIQDPSFVRENLSYEIARKYMPASGANFIKLYINDNYWGVYTNVESVNKAFLRNHFGSSENAFFKANPESLNLTGENCNLSNSPGTDSSNYTALYELRSDYGYSDLYDFIHILNTKPDSIEKVLNVDRSLWMHAFNYVLVNFDSYVGYAQNYYLYKDQNGQFNPVLWDLNQSFASFRLADASIHFNGFSIAQAKSMDPLLHHNNVSVYPRPLMRNLFNNQRYRKMYLAHIRTITEENFSNQAYKSRAQTMQNQIDSAVKNDPYKFYSYDHFKNNLNSTVTDLVEYPGISDLMDNRTAYLKTYSGYNGSPTIQKPSYTVSGNDLFINIEATSANNVFLFYRQNKNNLFTQIEMKDDGMNNDGTSSDGFYGVKLINQDENLQYYIYAENDSAGRFSPERAAYEYHTIDGSVDLVINEICASNETSYSDDQGQYDDWIELYNNTATDISLNGYYLSDKNTELLKWKFPNVSIPANGYLIVWADSDTLDSGLHANFKVSASGEGIYLSDSNKILIDDISFGQQVEDITFGRSPNGTGKFFTMKPTPNAYNNTVHFGNIGKTKQNLISIYRNPADNILSFKNMPKGNSTIALYDLNGRLIQSNANISGDVQLDVSKIIPGMYILSILNNDFRQNIKLIIK